MNSDPIITLPLSNQLMEFINNPVLFVQEDGVIVHGNQEAYNILQTSKGDSIEHKMDFYLLKDNKTAHLLMELKHKQGCLLEVKSLKLNEEMYCLRISELSIQNKSEEIRHSIHKLSSSLAEGVVLFDKTMIIDCDDTFSTMFGYTKDEIKHLAFDELMDSKSINQLMEQDTFSGVLELKGVKKDGSLFFMEMFVYPYYKNGRVIRAASIKDITERIENENKIEYMAYYDELTDLPNRNFFSKVLSNAIEQANKSDEHLAVFFLDIDYFKEINDTMGYAFGDELLKACANRLKTFQQMDTFIARMSGDEFLLLQRQSTKDDAITLAENLISEFEKPFSIRDYEIYTTVSIGISVFPENGTSASDLITHADSAMYVIKGKHRNYYNLFESSISENFKLMLTMEAELRKALRENQFELHYQPQKDLANGNVVGLEALLRWKHPEKGYISPAEFIPLAEKTGLIIEIGDWVLFEACRQNKEWQDQGFKPLTVSVNLSARQFYQPNLVQKINDILSDTGLAANYLELEITESMAMSNEEEILETLYELRSLGVLVSIDDFGTGYSSFKYLSVFPVSKLKIDRMFLNDKKKENRAIVKSIIHMSHSLNLRVIAEGVETDEQLAFLESERCDEMQGFLFSKPLPPNKLLKFLA